MTARWRAALLALLLGVAGTVGLTGCWGAPAIDRQGLVTLIGIDQAPHDQYRVTLDIVNPAGLPSPTGAGGQPGGKPVFVRSGVGRDVSQAISHIARDTESYLDLTHLKGVVVSESLARQGLAPVIGFVENSSSVSDSSWLFVCRACEALDLMRQTRMVTPEPGTALLQTALFGERHTAVVAHRMDDLEFRSAMRGDDFATTGVNIDNEEGTGKDAGFTVDGLAMFDGVRLVGWMDPPVLAGWLMDTGRLEANNMTVPVSNGVTTFMVRSAHRSLRVEPTASTPVVHLSVKIVGRMVEPPRQPPLDLFDIPTMHRLESELATQLWQRGAQAIRVGRAAGSDIFSFGQNVRVADPAYWQRTGASWETGAYRALPVDLQVHVTIQMPGDALCPTGLACSPHLTPAAP